jgi:hypothetical protein
VILGFLPPVTAQAITSTLLVMSVEVVRRMEPSCAITNHSMNMQTSLRWLTGVYASLCGLTRCYDSA